MLLTVCTEIYFVVVRIVDTRGWLLKVEKSHCM